MNVCDTTEGSLCINRDLLQSLSQCVNLEEFVCYELNLDSDFKGFRKELPFLDDLFDSSWHDYQTQIKTKKKDEIMLSMEKESQEIIINCASKFTKLKILQLQNLSFNKMFYG